MFTKKDKQSPTSDNMIKLTQSDYEKLVQASQFAEKLYNENDDLKKKLSESLKQIDNLKTSEATQSVINADLKKQLEMFGEKIAALEISSKNVQPGNPEDKNIVEYTTDEDELEKEIDPENIQRQSSKRRRKSPKVPMENDSKNAEKTHKEKPVKNVKSPLPPPINVSNVKNFATFSQKIIASASSAKFKATTANNIKITVQNEDEYRKIKKVLEEQATNEGDLAGIEYHTYQLKSERSFRVVIRGLPPTCEEEDVTTELKNLGHDVVRTTNIIKKIKNEEGKIIVIKFPLFMVEIKQNSNNKDVYDIKYLLNCKIKVEAPRKVTAIPQCSNCQQLGHTRNFCTRESRCVKCAGQHRTVSCTKKFNEAPKCVLCKQEGHTANYRGCSVYQKKLTSQNKPAKTALSRLRESHSEAATTLKPSETGLSYAQVTKNSNVNKSANTTKEPSISDMMQILTDINKNIGQLSNRLEKLEKLHLPNKSKVKQNKNE